MKKHAESLCAIVCGLLAILFVTTFTYAVAHFSGTVSGQLADAYQQLPWK